MLGATPSPQASYPATVLAGKPLAYYRLNDASSTLTDSSGSALNGTYGASVVLGGSPLTLGAQSASAIFAGKPGGSDVPSNSATVTTNAAFATAANALTVEAWIKPTALNGTNQWVPIVSYGREVQGQAWVLQLSSQSTLNFWFKVTGGTAGSYAVKTTTPLSPPLIYHVVATYNGATAAVYVNGALANSVAATGAINYSGISPQYGLAIGGALGSSEPIFNGAISDVAIYPSALSAATIQNHFLTGHLIPPLTETPVSSDAFVNTIGVVTHLSSTSSPYVTQWPSFQSLLLGSGIRHIGDSLVLNAPQYVGRLNTLAASGIRATLNTSSSQSSSDISGGIGGFASIVEAIAAPNEPDDQGDSNWVAHNRTFQQMLWSTIKGNPATATLPVLGSPLVSQADNIALGDLSGSMNMGNIHDYFNGFNPGTSGWGSVSQFGTYGSISYNRNIAAIVSGANPIMASETGYGDDPTDTAGVDGRTLSRYVPRMFLEQYLGGIARTTIYEFYDEGGNPGPFAHYGLVTATGTPKPSYTALKSLISVLADPGAPFSPSPVGYVLSGNTNLLHHLLLQKRDGTKLLVMWLETPSYNAATKSDVVVPAQSVTVQPSVTPTSASYATLDDAGNLSTSAVTLSGGVATVSVDDRVSVLVFR